MALNLSIRIDADGKAAVTEVNRVGAAIGKMGPAGQRGGQQAAEGIQRTERAAGSASKAITRLIAGFASLAAFRQLGRLADDFANINARLQIVTKTQERFAVAQAETLAIAQRTSSSLESTATLYGRLQRAVDDLGGSQRQALQLTETINQAFAVSGASATEANAAIIQLAQGLSAGALRGDEFNSVMEQAPRLAEALAASLGVTRGELRAMAEDGKLTSATIVNALTEQAEVIAAEFEKVPLTIERAWTRVQNAALVAVGEIEKASGAGQGFAQFLDSVARALPQITQEAIAFGQTVADQWGDAFNRANEAAGEFFTDYLRNAPEVLAFIGRTLIDGLAILPANIRLLVTQVIAYFDELRIGALQAFVNLSAGAEQALLLIQGAANLVAGKVLGFFASIIDELIGRFSGLASSLAAALDFAGLDEQAKALRSLSAALEEAAQFEGKFEQATNDRAAAIEQASAAVESARRQEIAALDAQIAASQDAVRAVEMERAAALDLLNERRKLNQATVELTGSTGKLTEGVEDSTDASKRNKEAQKALRLEMQLLKQLEEERRQILVDGGDAIRQLEDMLAQYSATLAGPAAQAELQHINNLREIAGIEADLLESGDLTAANIQRLAKLRAAASEIHKRELDDIAYASDEAAQAYDRAWTNAIDDVSVAFGDWIADGLDDFGDFADRIKDIFKRMIADMIAQMVKSGLMRMVAGLFGGGSSAAFAGTGGGFNFGSLLGGGGGFSQLLFGSGQASAFGSAFGTAVYGPGMATQWAPTALGSVGLAAAGLGGAYYGYRQSGNLAGAVGYGALGLGAAGAVGGIASGAGAIAGATGAFSSLGAAAAIPVIGWIAAIAALVDMVSGGKLFGTKFRPESLESSLNIGAEGGFATAELTEVRNRSLFRGRKWRTRDIDAGEEAEAAAVALFDNIAGVMADSARALEVEAPPVIDAAIRTVVEYDKKGREKSRKILVDVLGRTWEEATAELAATRITAEAIIQTVDSALGGIAEGIDASGAAEDAIAAASVSGGQIGEEFGLLYRKAFDEGAKEGLEEGAAETAGIRGEASAIAERWRGDAEQLLAGAQFLLAAATDIRRGTALLGEGSTLTQITDLVEELAVGGEPLVATYQRLVVSAGLLDQALEMSGVSLDKTREEIVRLAVDIADAAGGLDAAANLWTTYFNEFFTDQELAQQRLDAANAIRNTALQGLGLDVGISNDEFRKAFEEALPTLSAEEIVTWLQAGAAIAAANAAQEAYNATLETTAESSGRAAEALREYVAELEEARADYGSFVAELRRELETFSLSEFQVEMRDIREWGDEATTTLNNLARAAGLSAASEEDLALVHQIVAARTAEAIARLRNSARSLVEQLYGNAADPLLEATDDFVGSAIAGIADVGQASDQLYQSQLASIQRIQEYLDAQLLGDLTSLTPAEQFAEAQAQFDAAIQAALGGDADALAALPRLADILLRLGRDFDPSDFPELEAMVRAMLQQVAGLQPTDPGDIGSANGGGLFGNVGGPTGGLGQVVEGTANQVSEDRAELVAQLFVMVRDLIEATGLSLSEVADSIGLNVQSFISDMGINLDNLTVETVGQLAALSSRLGIRLDELATSVGLDLGALADEQSLLNDAVEQAIFGLPEEDRAALEPLFRRIETATSEADANAAIAELEAAVNQIGGATAAALAPFFGGINPGGSDINALLGSANTIAEDQLQELVLIRGALGGGGPGLPPTDPGDGGAIPGLPGLPGTGSSDQTIAFVPDESDAAVVAALTRIEDRLQSLEATTAHAGVTTAAVLGKRAQDAERARDLALVTRRR